MQLALLLIPLLPPLIQSVAAIVDAARDHPDTPIELKLQLEAISADLKAIKEKVEAVELPNP